MATVRDEVQQAEADLVRADLASFGADARIHQLELGGIAIDRGRSKQLPRLAVDVQAILAYKACIV
jgi:hypothetical protein